MEVGGVEVVLNRGEGAQNSLRMGEHVPGRKSKNCSLARGGSDSEGTRGMVPEREARVS